MNLRKLHLIIFLIGLGVGVTYLPIYFIGPYAYQMYSLWPFLNILLLVDLIILFIIEILQNNSESRSIPKTQIISYLMAISCVLPSVLFFMLARSGIGWILLSQIGILISLNVLFLLGLLLIFLFNVKKNYKVGLIPFVYAIMGFLTLATMLIGA